MLLAGGVSPSAPVCHPPPQKHCDRQKANLRIRLQASLPARGHPLTGGQDPETEGGQCRTGAGRAQQSPGRARRGGGRAAQGPPEHLCPSATRTRTWEARAADGAREPTSRGEHEPKTYQHFTLRRPICTRISSGPSRPLQGTSSASASSSRCDWSGQYQRHRPTLGEGVGWATAVEASPQISDPTDSPL